MKRIIMTFIIFLSLFLVVVWQARAITRLLGYYDTDFQPEDVAISSDGTTAYVVGWAGAPVGGDYDFQVIDVTNPAAPSFLGGLKNTRHYSNRIALSSDNTKAYISNYDSSFQIVDITNPMAPTLLGTYGGRTRDVAISSDEKTAYVSVGDAGLQIIDITNPASPFLLSTYRSDEPCTIRGVPAYSGNCTAGGVTVDNSMVYLAYAWGGLKIISTADPSSPRLIGTFGVSPGSGPIGNVHLSADGTKAYLTGSGGVNTANFHIVDISTPTSPVLLGQYTDPRGSFSNIALSSNEKIAYLVGGNVGLQILDVSNPRSPVLIDEFYEVINQTAPQASGITLSSDDSIAYVAEQRNGLRIVDVSGVANQPPVAGCQDVTVSADASCKGSANVDNGSSDPAGDTITLVQAPPSPYNLGSTAVNLTVTDNKGASDSCSANVTVSDNTPPSITCPDNQTAECTGPNGAPASFDATASDNCGGVITTGCSPASGSTFPLGTTPDNCTATDNAGNQSGCSFTVNVKDTKAPVADVASLPDVTGECSAEITSMPTATDICSGSISGTTSDPLSYSEQGTSTVTWSYNDGNGNTSTQTQTVIVDDITPPQIQCKSPLTIVPPNAPISFTASATDNCETVSPTITGYDCWMINGAGKKVDKKESCVVTINGDTINIVDSGGVDDHITWTVTADDGNGNPATSTCEVVVVNPGKGKK